MYAIKYRNVQVWIKKIMENNEKLTKEDEIV
jgi:transposase-like protein